MPLYKCSTAAYSGFLKYFNSNSSNGKMGRNELKAALNSAGCNPTSNELTQVIDLVSVSSDGISWQCFIDFIASFQGLRSEEQEYQEAFRIYDVSGSGSLSREDVKYVMEKLGMKVDADSLMNAVDTNRDGVIDYDEFVSMMKRKCF